MERGRVIKYEENAMSLMICVVGMVVCVLLSLIF